MGLYRGVGGVRDDLNIHEKALDILIELLKKEQVKKGAWPLSHRTFSLSACTLVYSACTVCVCVCVCGSKDDLSVSCVHS